MIDVTDVRQIIKVRPEFNQYYPNNPFMNDYLSSLTVEDKVDLVFTNGAPWSATVRVLRPSRLIADCPAHDNEVSVDEFKRLGYEYPYIHQTIPELFKFYSLYLQDADVVVVQAKMNITALEKLGLSCHKYEVIPGGTHLPPVIAPFPDKFTVGYLGATGSDKGLVYLYQAWQKLALGDEAECMLVGSNFTEKYHVLLEPFAKQATFHTMGRIDKLEEAYGLMSVYVQPSVTEGFSLSILEAMAHGRPVIVSKGAGASELITEGVDGFIVPIRDPGAIAERIEAFRKNPALMVRMGANARKTAEKYTWKRAKEEYERVIKGG
jgi:glycosyltransferase involved in cell wall biosynthesis